MTSRLMTSRRKTTSGMTSSGMTSSRMTIRRMTRRRPTGAPILFGPAHRRDWRRLWRRCTCGLAAPCIDRRVPATEFPIPTRSLPAVSIPARDRDPLTGPPAASGSPPVGPAGSRPERAFPQSSPAPPRPDLRFDSAGQPFEKGGNNGHHLPGVTPPTRHEVAGGRPPMAYHHINLARW